MDRLTRKELKTDKFALEVGHTVDYVSEHKKEITRYVAMAAALVLIIVGILAFMRYREGVRDAALRAALATQDGTTADQPQQENTPHFANQEEKEKGIVKAFTEVAAKYSGSRQGVVAEYYLGTSAADKGDIAGAEKHFKTVVDSGEDDYGSLAAKALAPIYASQGKMAEAEKILRNVIDHPTMFVSKEDATIALARVLSPTKPDDARKLLEPLKGESRSAVSRAALAALADIGKK